MKEGGARDVGLLECLTGTLTGFRSMINANTAAIAALAPRGELSNAQLRTFRVLCDRRDGDAGLAPTASNLIELQSDEIECLRSAAVIHDLDNAHRDAQLADVRARWAQDRTRAEQLSNSVSAKELFAVARELIAAKGELGAEQTESSRLRLELTRLKRERDTVAAERDDAHKKLRQARTSNRDLGAALAF